MCLMVTTVCVTPASGQEAYCAFEVKVTDPSGAAVAQVPVALHRQRGVVLAETTTDANGVARLCDAPLGAVEIVVGFDICGLVLVRDVKAEWPATRRVYVTYEKVPCPHFVYADTCLVLIRVRDERGEPLAAARIDRRAPTPGVGSGLSDAFGRLFLSVKRGEKVEGVITKEGYESGRFSEVCTDDIESKVALRKK